MQQEKILILFLNKTADGGLSIPLVYKSENLEVILWFYIRVKDLILMEYITN